MPSKPPPAPTLASHHPSQTIIATELANCLVLQCLSHVHNHQKERKIPVPFLTLALQSTLLQGQQSPSQLQPCWCLKHQISSYHQHQCLSHNLDNLTAHHHLSPQFPWLTTYKTKFPRPLHRIIGPLTSRNGRNTRINRILRGKRRKRKVNPLPSAPRLYTVSLLQLRTFSILTYIMFLTDNNAIDKDGMYQDVQVLEISEKDDQKKVVPTADITNFFTKVPRGKGDKKGRRQCIMCRYINILYNCL